MLLSVLVFFIVLWIVGCEMLYFLYICKMLFLWLYKDVKFFIFMIFLLSKFEKLFVLLFCILCVDKFWVDLIWWIFGIFCSWMYKKFCYFVKGFGNKVWVLILFYIFSVWVCKLWIWSLIFIKIIYEILL